MTLCAQQPERGWGEGKGGLTWGRKNQGAGKGGVPGGPKRRQGTQGQGDRCLDTLDPG